jgi:hypothetical protein
MQCSRGYRNDLYHVKLLLIKHYTIENDSLRQEVNLQAHIAGYPGITGISVFLPRTPSLVATYSECCERDHKYDKDFGRP